MKYMYLYLPWKRSQHPTPWNWCSLNKCCIFMLTFFCENTSSGQFYPNYKSHMLNIKQECKPAYQAVAALSLYSRPNWVRCVKIAFQCFWKCTNNVSTEIMKIWFPNVFRVFSPPEHRLLLADHNLLFCCQILKWENEPARENHIS